MKSIHLTLFVIIVSGISVFSQTLRELAEAKNKFIGTAVNNEYLDGNHSANPTGYVDALETEFNCVVAENAFKMGYLLTNQPANPFDFSISDFNQNGLARIDALLALAEAKNMRVRGHAFIWYNQAPQWLKNQAPNWTDQQVFDFAEEYIRVLGTYTKGKVDEWDVVNEAINDNGTPGYRTDGTWYAGVSSIQNFIDHCFNVAKEVDPDAKMYYNDYNIETKYIVKNSFMLDMVEGMKNRNVLIDGVGLQSHFISGNNTNTAFINEIGVTIDNLNDYGLESAITELDLRICGGTTSAALQEQSDEYEEITRMFLTKENCQSLLVWGVSDRGSWIPSTFPGCDDALLYDEFMNKKPAFDGVSNGFGIIEVGVLLPYYGTRISIPGRVEVEAYDLGGKGTAYNDNTTGNEGENFRNDDVDLAGTGDQGGGVVLGWAENGEWLKYSVDVTAAGKYQFTFRVASPIGGGEFEVLLNDETIINAVTVGITGSEWESYTDIEVENIDLEEGESTLEIRFINGGFNFNYIDINPMVISNNKEKLSSEIRALVFPNPSSSGVFNMNQERDWQVFSTNGELIKEGEGISIDLSDRVKGLYLLKTSNKITKLLTQ